MRLATLPRVGLVLLAAILAVVTIPNARALYEGIFFYLRDTVTYNPSAVQPIDPGGRYASVYDLVRSLNLARRDYILHHLALPGIKTTRIPVPNSALDDILVTFGSPGPYTVYSAHYDKLYDDIFYEGASDNTAAVSTLLACVAEFAKRNYTGNAAFLFTGEEETGLRGAQAFLHYAHANNVGIRENVNFDNLGRGKLAIRPSVTVPGYSFTIPFYGDLTYDGRTLRPNPPFGPANPRVTQELLRVRPDIVVYERFTALSDSNVFQANGIDTVAISGDDMRYLELTWHTYADRVELLDQRNLDLAFDLIVSRETAGH